MHTRLATPEDYTSLLSKYDTWMFDCDGVLWRGDQVVEGAVQVLEILRKQGKKVIFVTNNASKSRRSYKAKFDQLGVQAHVDEIFGSAYAAAVYISSILELPKDEKVYVIGMEGLEEELAEEGVAFAGGTDPADCTTAPFSLSPSKFIPDPTISAVVCGLDTRVTYTKLAKAFYYLSSPSHQFHGRTRFVLTNEDSTYPTDHGLLPGAGSLSASLKYALKGKGVSDPVCTGKPSSVMLDCIRAKVQYDPSRTIMIGDRLETDILFGKNGGLATLLVLTGVTTELDITGPNALPIVPDYVTNSIADFARGA